MNDDFYSIAVIGAGEVGSRHLQALALLKRPVKIFVVDPSNESLRIAKERFQQVCSIELLWFIRNPKKQGFVYNWLEYNF